MPEQEYQRLTRARSRSEFAVAFMSRTSLWLGKDHLLCVDSSGYTETYKRFYFRDIQAVILMATRRRAIWNWVLGAPTTIFLMLLLGTLAGRSNSNTVAITIYAVCASVFALPLVINNFLGPSCICHLRTAVQAEELPSLNRVHRAHKVLNRIRPFIVAAQGELPPAEIPARLRAAAVGSPDSATTAPDNVAPRPTVADNPDAPPVIT
ncbi:MAG: hypothetical protein ABSD57_04865 [Verrucomicrobiota bacterium]|jgi:hypothetical protein